MADEPLTDTRGDEDELVIVEVDDQGRRIGGEDPNEHREEEREDEHEDDEDEGGEDERLAQSQDDLDDDVTKQRNREKRLRRREQQKRAREHQENELRRLAQTNQMLMQRLEALEGHTMTREQQNVALQYQQAIAEARQAEQIIAKASSAGNGEDVVAAMRIRDEALGRANQAEQQYAAFTRAAQAPATPPPPNPEVVRWGQEWMRANPWYTPNGTDEDSAVVDTIDKLMTAQGYDPSQRSYWEELTRRVQARNGSDDDPNGGHVNQREQQNGRRRVAPPTGGGREHATARSRREVVVTAERKAAMQEAGVWDDPALRTRYLKSYQAYDKQHSGR